jgi:two-component system response regulator YesN
MTNNIRVIIVDDEEIIRRGIRSLLEKDTQISVVGQSGDGEEAFRIIAEKNPDLIFMDINIPFFNGLECIEKLQTAGFAPLIIIVSGYDDFSYAKKSIKLGVFDYILKPIEEKKFYEIVKNAKKELNNRKRSSEYLAWAKTQLESNKPLLVNNFMQQLLCCEFDDIEIREGMEYLKLTIPVEYTIFFIKFYSIDARAGTEWDRNLLFYAASNIAGKVFVDYPDTVIFSVRGTDIGILCGELSDAEILVSRDTLEAEFEKCIPFKTNIVFMSGRGWQELETVYDKLIELLDQAKQIPLVLQNAQAYIAKNYNNNLLSLTVIADELHVTPQHLSRLFRMYLDTTFIDYLSLVRIRKSVELLSGPDVKIYEVAEQTGYSSQHYFCTVFKKIMRMSPQEYRISLQNRKLS